MTNNGNVSFSRLDDGSGRRLYVGVWPQVPTGSASHQQTRGYLGGMTYTARFDANGNNIWLRTISGTNFNFLITPRWSPTRLGMSPFPS